jgi:HAD superfamily hydrolase (TIGR01509 family)
VTVRAVTLDFWGTLLADGPASDDRYKRRRLGDFASILAGAGVPVSAATLDRAYEQSASTLGRIWMRNRDVPVAEHVRALLDRVDGALADALPPETQAALARAYAEPALVVPPAVDAGALGALQALAARGLTLAVVSNTMRTPGATLRGILAHYGLLPYFSVLTFSDECGIRKPDPEIFRLTLRTVGIEAGEAVHVGDDSMLDVAGAHAAGMRAIQVTAAPRRSGPQKPEAVIPSLAALPGALARLDGSG